MRNLFTSKYFLDYIYSFISSIISYGLAWKRNSSFDDFDSKILFRIFPLQSIKNSRCIKKSTSTSNNNTLLYGCSCSTDSILNSVFNLINLDFWTTTYLNDSNASSKFWKPFLEFFLIIGTSCICNLFFNLINSFC